MGQALLSAPAQIPQHRSGLNGTQDQRPVPPQLGSDVAAEHSAVTVRARQSGRRVVASPADSLRRRSDLPLFPVSESCQHGEFALIPRPGSQLESALDSLVVGFEFGG